MTKLSTGAEIGFNLGITILMLLFINFGIMPLLNEAPTYPSTPCEVPQGPGSPNTCGTAYDAAQNNYQAAIAWHEMIVFWTSITIGIILLVGGLFIRVPAIT